MSKEKVAGGIPLVVIEEHHEAFYVWNYAIRKRWCPAENNTLLHVDAHADMLLPRLRRPLDSIHDFEDLARFVYRELDICSFIWPAVYMGLFTRLCWLRHRHRKSAGGWKTMSICSKGTHKTEFFIATSLAATPYASALDAKAVEFVPMTPLESLKTNQPVILDIDLDYFSCNEYPDPPVREIEITRAAHDEFQRNPYHFLRLAPGDKVSVEVRSGKYYLVFYNYYPESPDKGIREREAQERISEFIQFLQCHSMTPRLIVLCRSFYSGYTPKAGLEDLQATVLARLSELYSFKKFSIADILPAGVAYRPVIATEGAAALLR